jgi:WD40 repeat protein
MCYVDLVLCVCVCTQEGAIEVFDLGAAERVHSEAAHEGAVWSLAALPDKSGFISGSADKTVKFWEVREGLSDWWRVDV